MANPLNNIIQWNANGFFSKLEEIKILVKYYDPAILCIQETHTRSYQKISLKGYNVERKDDDTGLKGHSGVVLFIKNDIIYSPLQVNSPHQIVAIRLKSPALTICNLYLPPSKHIDGKEIDDILSQLPTPFLITTDANSHSPLWGSKHQSPRGRLLEKIIQDHNISLLNTGDQTYFSSTHKTFSAIDLTLSSSSLLNRLTWRIHKDLCSSDHYPIIISLPQIAPPSRMHARWKIDKGNWQLFNKLLTLEGKDNKSPSDLNHFMKRIIRAADASIPRTNTKPKHTPVPWWSKDIAFSISERKKALHKFQISPTNENLIYFKKMRARAKYLIKTAKKSSWKEYISSITYATPTKIVWEKIKKIQGSATTLFKPLIENSILISNPFEIANSFARYFSRISSSQNYDRSFIQLKNNAENSFLDFSSCNNEAYNLPFRYEELEHALCQSKKSAPGPDNIHNVMLKNMNFESKVELLEVLNNLWLNDTFPDLWKRAILIPILKPNKPTHSVESYRPISLTSCVSKLLERMVNKRLVWVLENGNLISNQQCGFRQRRSCMDHLTRLEDYIQNSFIMKQHTIAVFFDLEKAFDRTWRYLILEKIHKWGFKGHLAYFIKNFLSDRKFQVRIGNTLSQIQCLENGVPQGAVISTTLFSIAVNDIEKYIKSPVQYSLFVDDLTIYLRSSNLTYLKAKLQSCINSISKWASERGFKISTEKTSCMHFCRLRKQHEDPLLLLNANPIVYKDSNKFLGLIMDKKLNWKNHIEHLRIKCLKSLNLMKVLSNTNWGADSTSLIRVYRTLIRSKLDYGAPIYASARESVVKKLDTIHNSGIRIALGSFRTSPILSILAEADEPPLRVRRQILAMSYIIKMKCMPTHPTFKNIFRPTNTLKFAKKPGNTRPLSIRMYDELAFIQRYLDEVVTFINAPSPPWLIAKPKIIWDLLKFPKDSTSRETYSQLYKEILNRYPSFNLIFTDGSKFKDKVGCAFWTGETNRYFKISSISSIFTAELKAIELALSSIKKHRIERCLILSDSVSALSAMNNIYSGQPLVQKILHLLDILVGEGKKIYFVWIPGHQGICGNEAVDLLAKKGAHKSNVDLTECYSEDLNKFIKQGILKNWRNEWDDIKNNHLKIVYPKICPLERSDLCRKKQVIISRLRIGHTYFSHGFLLRRENPPWCISCHRKIDVSHILIDCPLYEEHRKKCNLRNKSLTDILSNQEEYENVFKYLKIIKLIDKI